MYNSLFWSISTQDAVTQGGFLVDIVDDDIPECGTLYGGMYMYECGTFYERGTYICMI